MRFVDLTHTFDGAMPVYPGDPAAKLFQTAFIGEQGYNDFCIHSGMHVGTHMDAPLHMIPGGAYLSDIPIETFFGRGCLIDARGKATIGEELLEGVKLCKGDIVLLLTGWYKKFRDPEYYIDFPPVDSAFARRLVAAEISILALDTPTPDRPPFPVHKILLSHNILIIENLNNVELLVGAGDFDVTALPTKFRCEAAPVRVTALMNSPA